MIGASRRNRMNKQKKFKIELLLNQMAYEAAIDYYCLYA